MDDSQAEERVYPIVKRPCAREGYVVWMQPGLRAGACVRRLPDLETEWVHTTELAPTGKTVTVTVVEDR